MFECPGRDVSDRGMQAHPVAPDLDPDSYCVLDLNLGSEGTTVIELTLQRAPQGLVHGVVQRTPPASIGDGCQVQPALPSAQVGDVGNPDLVQRPAR